MRDAYISLDAEALHGRDDLKIPLACLRTFYCHLRCDEIQGSDLQERKIRKNLKDICTAPKKKACCKQEKKEYDRTSRLNHSITGFSQTETIVLQK